MLGSKIETLLAVAEFRILQKRLLLSPLPSRQSAIISISWKKNWESPFLSAEKAV